MAAAADILVYDDNRDLLLLAEVRALPETDAAWGAEVRADIARLRRGKLPPYFMVIARDTTYLWNTSQQDAPPYVQVATEEILGEYFREAGLNVRDAAWSTLELAAGIWLQDLTNGDARATRAIPAELAQAAVNGRMEFANAA